MDATKILLDGIQYSAIENSDAIRDFLVARLYGEWKVYATQHMSSSTDIEAWMTNLRRRRWSLEAVLLGKLKLDPIVLAFSNPQTGYVFKQRLQSRATKLRTALASRNTSIWPITVQRENWLVLDGYCRYTALRQLKIPRVYAYVGEPILQH